MERAPRGKLFRSWRRSALAVLMNNVHKGIILESEDSSVRVRLTIDQLVGEIEDRYSNELATTLFGGRLPE